MDVNELILAILPACRGAFIVSQGNQGSGVKFRPVPGAGTIHILSEGYVFWDQL